MIDVLPPVPLLSAFVIASVALAVSPGPGVVYVVTRSLVQGPRAGLVSVAGVAIGNLGNVVAASMGLAALFAVSTSTFVVVKYAGALYLIYLGVRMLRFPGDDASPDAKLVAASGRVLGDGIVVALLNPKTALFFAAFLPQFVASGTQPMARSLVLGSMFVAIAAVTDSLYALASSAVAPALSSVRGARRLGRSVGAFVLIALGVAAALSGIQAPG
jgi:threonine/homoserine/homoserine lactone efflux protein